METQYVFIKGVPTEAQKRVSGSLELELQVAVTILSWDIVTMLKASSKAVCVQLPSHPSTPFYCVRTSSMHIRCWVKSISHLSSPSSPIPSAITFPSPLHVIFVLKPTKSTKFCHYVHGCGTP